MVTSLDFPLAGDVAAGPAGRAGNPVIASPDAYDHGAYDHGAYDHGAYDHGALRTALGQYATGVAVVTAIAPDNHPAGITVNSFGSLSLDPPLILWCLRRRSASLATFTTSGHFAVNVLAAGQEAVARRFAARSPDRFAGLRWRRGPRGLPVLDGRLGIFICRRVRHIQGGDHVIIIGHLEEYQVTVGQPPLIFHNGRYRSI